MIYPEKNNTNVRVKYLTTMGKAHIESFPNKYVYTLIESDYNFPNYNFKKTYVFPI